jgi:hypothetical protein
MVINITMRPNERLMKMGISMLHAIIFQIVKESPGCMKYRSIGRCTPVFPVFMARKASGPMLNPGAIQGKRLKKRGTVETRVNNHGKIVKALT